MDLETAIQSSVRQEGKKQIPYANTYMRNLEKILQMILFAKQKQRHRHREQTYEYQGEKEIYR